MLLPPPHRRSLLLPVSSVLLPLLLILLFHHVEVSLALLAVPAAFRIEKIGDSTLKLVQGMAGRMAISPSSAAAPQQQDAVLRPLSYGSSSWKRKRKGTNNSISNEKKVDGVGGTVFDDAIASSSVSAADSNNSGSTRAGRRRVALSNIRETRRLNKEKQVWAALSTLETDSKYSFPNLPASLSAERGAVLSSFSSFAN